MAGSSKIEWTEATWNPVTGCTHVSEGCRNCYAATMTARLESMGQERYAGLTVKGNHGVRFNGTVRWNDELLDVPLRRRTPATYFVNSMSDLFHPDVPIDFIARAWDVMASATTPNCRCGVGKHDAECFTGPPHTFQILTKRPERAATVLADLPHVFGDWPGDSAIQHAPWPLPNVWIGTSCEDQSTAEERIPHLLDCRAAVRFLSLEPLLGPIDLLAMPRPPAFNRSPNGFPQWLGQRIHWVIVGGESGPKARPMDPAWVRSIRAQCALAGIPFFFKQWGGRNKKAAGRVLDGRTYDAMPANATKEE